MTSCIIVLWLTTFVVLASSEPQFPYYSGYFGPHSTSFQRWHPYQQGMQMSPFIPVMVMHPFPQHQQYPSSIPIRDSISGAQSPLQSVFPFFWNPFSVSQPQPFGSTRISYRQNNCESNLETGTCYTRQECRDRKGSIGQGLYCRDFTKTCCISHHTCGDSTNVPSSYFRSKNWPLRSTISSSCKFVVNKDTNICAVRINFKSLALPASIGYCDGIGIEATGTDQALMPLCGPLSGKSYDIEFKNSDSISLDIKTVQTFKLYWNIHVTQVKCSENLKTTWPSKGISEPVQTTNSQIPETKPVVVKPVSTVVKPPPPTLATQPKCGASKVKRKSFGHPTFRIRDYGQVPQQIHECIDHSGVNSCSPDDPSSPILNSLDWEVPMVNNSIFFKIAGPPHIQSVRITYGRKTQPHEYPWAVAMYSNGRFHCGASLISDQHVLTAAHCVIRKKSFPASLQLSIGDWDINSKADGPSLKRNIKHIATHPGYSTVTLKYDVAVLTLSEKVTFTDFIQPVCLPSTDSALSDDLVTVIGWGRDEKNRLQSTLMEHEASLVSNDLCNTRWQKKGAPAGIIAPTMLCMDPQSGDSCKGDSGGPLIMPDAEGKFQQIGIVSFGSASCTDPNLPGVYTNVGKMITWIKEEMDKKH